jgi:hypothetical protein
MVKAWLRHVEAMSSRWEPNWSHFLNFRCFPRLPRLLFPDERDLSRAIVIRNALGTAQRGIPREDFLVEARINLI